MRELLTSLPAAVAYVAGPDLVFEFANDDYRTAANGRRLVGLPYREALPELAGTPRYQALLRVLRTGEPHRSREEVWLRRPGAEPEQVHIDALYEPVRGESGAVAGVLIFGTDVSDHVRARRQLQDLADRLARSEERYRTLFETLPHGLIRFQRSGSIVGANAAAIEILGVAPDHMTPVERARRTVHEDGTPFRPDELPAMAALRTGETVRDVLAGVRNTRTGQVRWVRITAVPGAFDDRGRAQRAYSMLTDVTEQRRAEAALRQSSRLLERLRDDNVLGVVASTEAGIYDANDAFLHMIGYRREDVRADRLSDRSITPEEWAAQDRAAVAQLWSAGAFQAYEKEYLHRDGRRVPVMVGGAVVDRTPLRWVTFVVDLTAPRRAERERAALRAEAERAAAEAAAARERLAFLLRAGSLVAATRSRQELLDQVAALVVPTLADSCVVFLPTPAGQLRAAALAWQDPVDGAALESLRGMDVPPDGPLLVQTAYTSAAVQFLPDVGGKAPPRGGAAREIRDIERRALLDSALATPLLAGERPLGALLMGRGGARPRFRDADVPVAEELARRLAAGLGAAQTFAREHTVAETLQRALLPDALPVIPGLDMAVRYLPATSGVEVGGDWYDAFGVDGDRVGLTIGDVVGHSIASASIMGQVRSLVRGYAVDEPSPPEVLRRTNTALTRMLPEALATLFYAVLDLRTGSLVHANAGHPPPLVRRGDRAEYLDDAPGPMLGAAAGAVFEAGTGRLEPGAIMLLYTDGLIEDRRRDIGYGLDALAAALERAPGPEAVKVADSVQEALLGLTPRDDDVCVFAVRLTRRG